MKKFLTLILALIYVTARSGVVLNVHYCMGEISSVEVDNFNKHICKCSNDAAAEMSCCFSEFKVVKLEDVHKATVIASNIQVPAVLLPSSLSLIDISKTYSPETKHPVAHAPPISSSPKLYIKNCVFRI